MKPRLVLALALISALIQPLATWAEEGGQWRTLSTARWGALRVGVLQERRTGYVMPQLLAGWPRDTMRVFNAARAQELQAQVQRDLSDGDLTLEDTGVRRIEWFTRQWLVWWEPAWTASRGSPHPDVSVSSRVFDLRSGREVDVLRRWFEDSPALDRLLSDALRHAEGRAPRDPACDFFGDVPQAALYTRDEAGLPILRVSIYSESSPAQADPVMLLPTRQGLALRTNAWAEPLRSCREADLARIPWSRLQAFMKPDIRAQFSARVQPVLRASAAAGEAAQVR